ncbi:hypothetical protein ACFPRL_24895 [Pseudoclavibacter helvolus]
MQHERAVSARAQGVPVALGRRAVGFGRWDCRVDVVSHGAPLRVHWAVNWGMRLGWISATSSRRRYRGRRLRPYARRSLAAPRG